jgi:hypothetical protein
VQVAQEGDSVFGISGLHQIRAKIEPLQNDYLEVLGADAIRHVKQNYAWYFPLFGYHIKPAS